jgi:ABC-2 type transport system ATP-binding protein
MKGDHAIAFRAAGLVKRYRRARALDGLDLELEPGRMTVLLGHNGAGKSTLLRAALGVVKPERGSLVVAGQDPLRRPDEVRRKVGYVPDRPDAPPWMTIAELCRFSRAHQPRWSDRTADELIDALDVPRETRLGAMSKGQGMKAMLVLALAHDPDVLLLDEPFGGLDPLVREDVLRAVIGALRSERRTVLCATHELDVAARIADRVAIVAAGRVLRHGTVADVLGGGEPADLPRGLHDALAAATREVATC